MLRNKVLIHSQLGQGPMAEAGLNPLPDPSPPSLWLLCKGESPGWLAWVEERGQKARLASQSHGTISRTEKGHSGVWPCSTETPAHWKTRANQCPRIQPIRVAIPDSYRRGKESRDSGEAGGGESVSSLTWACVLASRQSFVTLRVCRSLERIQSLHLQPHHGCLQPGLFW